jgi:uncharacterized repeat protein (TIGR01451 family)
MARVRWIARLVAVAAVLSLPLVATTASASDTVTFTGTQTIPVPPASQYTGTGGGDGWAVALTPTAVYNVFHHNSELTVACHLQTDERDAQGEIVRTGGSGCWGANVNRTITDENEHGFSTSGEPGLWLDQGSGHLYAYATRASDGVAGIVCIDTVAAGTSPGGSENPFCGFTALTAAGDAYTDSWSAVSNPVAVGSHWYALNYYPGSGATGDRNKLLCFDLQSFAACAGQPYSVASAAAGTMNTSLPSPAIAAIGTRVIIPTRGVVNDAVFDGLGCFDDTTLKDCSGSWPVQLQTYSYIGNNGAPFPLLSTTGEAIGVCLPTGSAPCFDLSGGQANAPSGLAAAMGSGSSPWNGPAFVLGPRVYLPNGNTNQVHCYDYNLAQGCSNFPKSFSNLGYLYTVNADPQRPTCIWVNADNGANQIQNFDAFGGGGCGQGPIRVLAQSFLVNAPRCTPGDYTSLQVTSPTPSAYTSGSVAFQDPSGNAIQGASDVALDATGTAALSGLGLNTNAGLPQFLITLNGTEGTPGEVVVKLTWTGTYDPTCAAGDTTIVNPPQPTPTPPPSTTGPSSDPRISVGAPAFARLGGNVTFTATATNGGPNTSTNVRVQAGVPEGSTLVSATLSNGTPCSTPGGVISCFVGPLASGASSTATIVVTPGQTGPLSLFASVVGDADANVGNNTGSATAPIIAQDATPPPPPPPSQPGTFNSIATGTVLVNGVAVPADQLFTLHSGDVIDVTNGFITFTDFAGGTGTFSGAPPTRTTSSRFRVSAGSLLPAQFRIDQQTTGEAVTTLTLTGGDFSVCTAPRRLDAKKKQGVRLLWGHAKGKFRTRARFSSATIRGTTWLTEDRCDGSLTTAVDDFVDVVDLSLHKTLTLNPGESYLASAGHVPAASGGKTGSTRSQSAADVRQHGLRWAGKTFATKAKFADWLSSRGASWQHFAAKHAPLAEALSSRR